MKRSDFGGYGDVAEAFNNKGPYIAPWVIERLKAALLERDVSTFGANVIDIGCGTGNFTRTLARAGFSNVIGVDPDPRMISVANSSQDEESPRHRNPTYRVGDVFSLPDWNAGPEHVAKKNRLHLAICHWTFDNFCDDAHAVDTLVHRLSPYGIFASVTWPSSDLSEERSKTIRPFISKRRKHEGSVYTRGDRSYAPLLLESRGFQRVETHMQKVNMRYDLDEAKRYMRRSGRLSMVPKAKLPACHEALDALCERLFDKQLGYIARDIVVILDIAFFDNKF